MNNSLIPCPNCQNVEFLRRHCARCHGAGFVESVTRRDVTPGGSERVRRRDFVKSLVVNALFIFCGFTIVILALLSILAGF